MGIKGTLVKTLIECDECLNTVIIEHLSDASEFDVILILKSKHFFSHEHILGEHGHTIGFKTYCPECSKKDYFRLTLPKVANLNN